MAQGLSSCDPASGPTPAPVPSTSPRSQGLPSAGSSGASPSVELTTLMGRSERQSSAGRAACRPGHTQAPLHRAAPRGPSWGPWPCPAPLTHFLSIQVQQPFWVSQYPTAWSTSPCLVLLGEHLYPAALLSPPGTTGCHLPSAAALGWTTSPQTHTPIGHFAHSFL